MAMLSRREVVAGLVGGAALAAATSVKGLEIARSTEVRDAEYMFEPGLNYLNTASLSPTPRTILEKTLTAWNQLESNPVRMAYGQGATAIATDRATEQLARLIGCSADELMLTMSTTDAMNKLSRGITFAAGDRILTTDVEHEGGSVCWKYLKRKDVIDIDTVSIAPDDHDVKAILGRFEKAITKRTRVISVSHVITSTGLRMPIVEIAALARNSGILCVVDGAQAVGGIDVDVKALGCDAYAAPGHKWLMAPKGTGFLYIRKDASKLIQPVERESGTRFVSSAVGVGAMPLIVGLGAAAEAMKARGMQAVESRIIELRNRAYAGLIKIPRIKVVSPPPGPLATALISFKIPDNIDSKAFRDVLESKYKIIVKIGEKRWFNGNRISPHIFNTEAEIDAAVNAIRAEIT